MEARMEADKLIAEGRMKEAEQVLQIGMKRLEAISQEEQFNRTLSKDLTVFFIQIHTACERMSRENEIAVHLVHHPGHVVFQADLCNSF